MSYNSGYGASAGAAADAVNPWEIQYVTKEFTTAQLVASMTTPQLILAGVAGYIYVPVHRLFFTLFYNGTHLTNMDSYVGYIVLGTSANNQARFGYIAGENFGAANYSEEVGEGNFGRVGSGNFDYWAATDMNLVKASQSGTLANPGSANDSLRVTVLYYKMPIGVL